MSIVIGADAAGVRLKEVVKDFLEKENFHVVDVTADGQDFVDVTLAVAEEVKKTIRQNAPQASADGISNTDNYGSRLAQKAVRSSGKII